jgi:hypothetical protein
MDRLLFSGEGERREYEIGAVAVVVVGCEDSGLEFTLALALALDDG